MSQVSKLKLSEVVLCPTWGGVGEKQGLVKAFSSGVLVWLMEEVSLDVLCGLMVDGEGTTLLS